MAFLSSGYYDGVTVSGGQLAVCFVLLGAIVLAAVAVNVVPRLVHKWEIEYKTRDLTYGAACLAIGYALSWAGVSMPLGGTVTIAALAPVFLYCYYFGFRKGMVLASAYMLLQLTQKIYIVHPLSLFFDYIFPYFSVCVVGLFAYNPNRYAAFVKKHKSSETGAKAKFGYWAFTVGGHWGVFLGAAIHMVLRYASSVFSGVICWDYWGYEAAELAYKLTFSLTYNSVLLIDSAIAIAATVVLLSSRTFNLYMSASFADKSAYIAAAKGEVAAEPATAESAETEIPSAAVEPNETETATE